MNKSLAFLTLAAVLAGCGPDPQTSNRLNDLEERVAKLEKNPSAKPIGKNGERPKPAPVDKEKETAAAALLKEANKGYEAMDYDLTKAKIKELKDKFPKTRAARAAQRLESELEIIGKPAGELKVDQWFQGNADLNASKATLLVFWEVWCPHCKREVPKIESTYQKFKGKGFNIVGLTKMTRNITEDQVKEFLSSNKVTYPVAKEKGQEMSNQFGVKGIPAAAVVKDGKVVWRGHPARVTDQMIETWIK